MTLFDPGPSLTPEREADVSATRRLTLKRERLLAAGIHPRTNEPLTAAAAATCGNCDHHFAANWRAGRYHKCNVDGLVTHGPATDVRVSWPGCIHWTPVDEGTVYLTGETGA